jgi:hypothetical protein
MVVAKIYPGDQHGGDRKSKSRSASDLEFPMVSKTSLKYARMILREAPDLADGVLDGSLSLEKAAHRARLRSSLRCRSGCGLV